MPPRQPLPPFKVVSVVPQSQLPRRATIEIRQWWDVPCRNGSSCAHQSRCHFKHDLDSIFVESVLASFDTKKEAQEYAEAEEAVEDEDEAEET